MQLLQPGNKIPYFNLLNQRKIQVSSLSFLGNTILIYFYPKSMSPGCTIQARELSNNTNIFKKLGIEEIIGISIDKPETLLKFYEKEMLNFTLLYDENHQISKKFGVWGEKKFMGAVYQGIHRVSFLVNQHSIIEKVFENFNPDSHVQIILNYLHNKL